MDDSEPITPVSPEIGVVAMVPDTWGQSVWQVRHQVLTRLSHYFHVVWVNPPLGWRQALRESPWSSRFVAADPGRAPSLTIYDHSKWCAKIYRPKSMARLTEKARVHAAVAHLKNIGCKSVIGYLWRPQFASEYWAGEFDRRCYHIDDEYTFSEKEQPINDLEYQIIKESDVVIIHSPALMEKKGKHNPNTFHVPNGVDFKAYNETYPLPHDLQGVSRPIVEYTGVLKSMLDWELIQAVVQKMPELSFVFIGPEGRLSESDRTILNALKQQSNVIFLGTKPAHMLPAYTTNTDIGIMPYRVNSYTKYIFPLKVNEYLASGKPTIGTRIRSLQDFSEVIDIAQSIDEWCAALQRVQAPENNSKTMISRRKARAKTYDWDGLVKIIAQAING